MKKALLLLGAALSAIVSVHGQGVPLYRNFGLLTYPGATPIDAVRVENLGTINASGTLLWDTQDTLEFINRGQMSASPGFRFDYLPYNSAIRKPLSGFTNTGAIYTTGDLLIRATNVNNFNGLLSAGRLGKLVITSTNGNGTVDLFNSRLRAGDGSDLLNSDEGFRIFVGNTPRFYVNPQNVVDEYWGVDDTAGNISLTGFLTNTTVIFNGTNFTFANAIRGGWAPFFATNRGAIRLGSSVPALPLDDGTTNTIPGYSFFVSTNLVPINNAANQGWRMMVQAVLVQTNLIQNPQVKVYFYNNFFRNNFTPGFAAVEFGLTDFDEVTGQPIERYLLLQDRTATNIAGGNFVGSTAIVRNDVHLDTFRPDVFELVRSDSPLFPTVPGFGGFETPAIPYDPGYFYYDIRIATNQGARFQTNLVPHAYSAWQFLVTPRDVPPGSLQADDVLTGDAFTDQVNDATNSPGRIEINAKNLDLGSATLRAQNTITITASNILDMANSRLNAQHVNINVNSTNSTLVLSNTMPNSVARMHGGVTVWSGFWQVDQLVTNAVSTGIPSVPELDGTNTIDTIFHVMVVSLDDSILKTFTSGGSSFFSSFQNYNMSTNQPVDLPRLNAMSQMVELHDTNTITRQLNLGGQCLLIGTNGFISLTDGLQTFGAENAPELICFTNAGTLTVPQHANFGYDRFDASGNPKAYSNIVNYGSIFAESLLFRSDYFENQSNLFASGGSIFVEAVSNRLSGNNFASLRAVFSGSQLVTSNANISVGGDLQLSLTDVLSDAGVTNNWSAAGGVTVDTHPAKGDLYATRLYLSAPTNLNRTIIWAGQDRGGNPAGYLNNIALQELVLDGQTGSLFRFRGSSVSGSAMYINTITLTNNTTNYATALAVDSNIKVYFANSTVPPDKLTNAFPGRLIWVSTNTAAGPLVSVKSSLSGRLQMTSSALASMLATSGDVDDDGIANDLDETPLSGFTVNDVRVINLPPQTAVVTWQGVAGWTYILEYKDDLSSPYWTKLKTLIPSQTGTVTELDALPAGGQRFYQVRFTRP